MTLRNTMLFAAIAAMSLSSATFGNELDTETREKLAAWAKTCNEMSPRDDYCRGFLHGVALGQDFVALQLPARLTGQSEVSEGQQLFQMLNQ